MHQSRAQRFAAVPDAEANGTYGRAEGLVWIGSPATGVRCDEPVDLVPYRKWETTGIIGLRLPHLA